MNTRMMELAKQMKAECTKTDCIICPLGNAVCTGADNTMRLPCWWELPKGGTATEKQRGFEPTQESTAQLPTRADSGAAGYDLYAPADGIVPACGVTLLWLGIKAYMLPDESLEVYIRSSLGAQGITLSNAVGLIDSSYYNNKKNEGNIGIMLHNFSHRPFFFKQGDRLAQGVFRKYLVADDDTAVQTVRGGGCGSSGR